MSKKSFQFLYSKYENWARLLLYSIIKIQALHSQFEYIQEILTYFISYIMSYYMKLGKLLLRHIVVQQHIHIYIIYVYIYMDNTVYLALEVMLNFEIAKSAPA